MASGEMNADEFRSFLKSFCDQARSACVTVLRHEAEIYLVDVWRGRLAYPDLRAKIISHSKKFDADDILIERAGSGLHLLQDVAQSCPQGMLRPISIRPEGDKQVRMEAASALIERGDVLLPQSSAWIADFLAEMLGFPYARNDDQVDALSQLLNWASKRAHAVRREAYLPNLYGKLIGPHGQEF